MRGAPAFLAPPEAHAVGQPRMPSQSLYYDTRWMIFFVFLCFSLSFFLCLFAGEQAQRTCSHPALGRAWHSPL